MDSFSVDDDDNEKDPVVLSLPQHEQIQMQMHPGVYLFIYVSVYMESFFWFKRLQ